MEPDRHNNDHRAWWLPFVYSHYNRDYGRDESVIARMCARCGHWEDADGEYAVERPHTPEAR